MEEKLLIKSKHYNPNIVALVLLCIVIILCIVACSINFGIYYSHITEKLDNYEQGYGYCRIHENEIGIYSNIHEIHPSPLSYAYCQYKSDKLFSLIDTLIWCTLPIWILIVLILYLWFKKFSLTVTDKRVYGVTGFGKKVELPFDKVSTVSTSCFKGISVATSSGYIQFKFIKNRDEIHDTISNLIINRQKELPTQNVQSTPVVATSNADELMKYKNLLDAGAITEEEYNSMKKKILGM